MPSAENTYTDPDLLLKDFREGKLPAIKAIFDLYSHTLASFTLRLVKQEDVRDDIVAETFIKCWERRSSFTTFQRIRFFLFAVAKNASLSHLRQLQLHARKNREIVFFQTLDTHTLAAEEIRADLFQEVLLAGAQLPPRMKEVFELLYIDQLSLQEAAEKLQLSVNTIKVQRNNALSRIREYLAQRGMIGIWFL